MVSSTRAQQAAAVVLMAAALALTAHRWGTVLRPGGAALPAGVVAGPLPAPGSDPRRLPQDHPPLARAWAHAPVAGAPAALAHAQAGVSPVLTGRLEEALGLPPALALAALVPALEATLHAACPDGPASLCDAAEWAGVQERLPRAVAEVLEDPDPRVAAELAVVVCGHPALAARVVEAAPAVGEANDAVEGLLLFLEACAGNHSRAELALQRGPPAQWPALLLHPTTPLTVAPDTLAAALLRLQGGSSASNNTALSPAP